MSVGPADGGGDEDQLNSTINTTPLVDIMLVMLIIFLITIPVAIKSAPVQLPVADNQVTVTKPENIVLAVDKDGNIYWNDTQLANTDELLEKLGPLAQKTPQPEVHIRGDRDARYEFVGKVVVTCQRAGILKVGFITNPETPGSVAPLL
jgi:biopolymer transport protein ExbD